MSDAPEPVRRLAALLRAPGGITIKDALARARVRVKEVRAKHTDMLAEKVALAAEAIAVSRDYESVLACVLDLRVAAQCAEAEDLAEAAKSLCNLLNHLGPAHEDGRKWIDRIGARGRDAIDVHAEGLVLLSQLRESLSAQDRKALLMGLHDVAERIRGA